MGILLPALVAVLAFSCGSVKNEKMDTVTFRVNSYRTPCAGVAPMDCLQIQKEGSDSWELFYSEIEGFQYEPGYLYRIRVREEPLDPALVPADASSIKYTLVSIEEKSPDRILLLNDIWKLEQMEGRRIPDEALEGRLKRPHIEFHIRENRYMGTDGCNTFRGHLEALDDRELLLGPAMSTKMSCGNMDLPNGFLHLLSRVNGYVLGNGSLSLLEGETELLKFRKTD